MAELQPKKSSHLISVETHFLAIHALICVKYDDKLKLKVQVFCHWFVLIVALCQGEILPRHNNTFIAVVFFFTFVPCLQLMYT